ncbi:MAG: transglycosylase SLT domain-containing protein [Candidatus Tumulicola sp.]
MNPFAGLSHTQQAAIGPQAGLTLGPTATYPGTPGPAFGVPPASDMRSPSVPQAAAQAPAVPPADAPISVAPAPQTDNLDAALQAALKQYDATPMYQQQAVQYEPPTRTENPKGDAISAGVQLLGAALAPQLAPQVSQNLAGAAKQSEDAYQRSAVEAKNRYTAAIDEQQRLAANSQAALAQQEKHIEALMKMQESQDRAAERLHETELRVREAGERDAALMVRSQAYMQSVRDKKTIFGQSLAELRSWHLQQMGLGHDKLAESRWARMDMDQTALTRAGISQTTALRVAGIHARAELALAAFNDRSKELIASNRDAALTFRAELTQADAAMSNLIKAGSSPNVSPAIRAKIDAMAAPGGPIDQLLKRGEALGIHSPPTPEVEGLDAVQSGLDLGPVSETASPNPSAGTNYNYYGAPPPPTGYPAYPSYPPDPSGSTAPQLPGTLKAEWLETMGIAGEHYGVRPELLHRMALQESSGNPNAVSSAGAQGLMQFMPASATAYGVNPFDPISAINGAAHYMHDSLKQYGDERLALVNYNGGPNAVAAWKAGHPYQESTDYVNRILGGQETDTTTTTGPTAPGDVTKPPTTGKANQGGPRPQDEATRKKHIAAFINLPQMQGLSYEEQWQKLAQAVAEGHGAPEDYTIAQHLLREHNQHVQQSAKGKAESYAATKRAQELATLTGLGVDLTAAQAQVSSEPIPVDPRAPKPAPTGEKVVDYIRHSIDRRRESGGPDMIYGGGEATVDDFHHMLVRDVTQFYHIAPSLAEKMVSSIERSMDAVGALPFGERQVPATPAPARTAQPMPPTGPTPNPRALPTPGPTDTPTPRPTPTPLPTATAQPTLPPVPIAPPTYLPATDRPTARPTEPPHIAAPTLRPLPIATPKPTATPTARPTAAPTARPTAMPTPQPERTIEPLPANVFENMGRGGRQLMGDISGLGAQAARGISSLMPQPRATQSPAKMLYEQKVLQLTKQLMYPPGWGQGATVGKPPATSLAEAQSYARQLLHAAGQDDPQPGI